MENIQTLFVNFHISYDCCFAGLDKQPNGDFSDSVAVRNREDTLINKKSKTYPMVTKVLLSVSYSEYSLVKLI